MMESDENKRDNSAKAWSNAVQSPEQVNVNAISAHSYKCIFCKRGFSTGPALGGHMNIHRRDRAKAMSDPVLQVYQKPDEGLESFGYYLPQVDHHSLYPPVSELPKRRCTSYLMESSSTIRDMRLSGDEETSSRSPYELSLFSKELHQGLGIHAETVGKRKGECGELDLELRLGPRAVRHRVA